MKDLIIGGASNYDWDKLKYWVNSINRSGFSGDVILVCTNIDHKTIEKLSENGVVVSLYGDVDNDGNVKSETIAAPHVIRFFYMWHVLNAIKEGYRYCITTDTRDVIFQTNPSDWIENNLEKNLNLIASSEGLLYKDEPWGNNNLEEAFGKIFHQNLCQNLIYNVGTIAGDFNYVKDMLLMIFQMSINRPKPIVDQAVYNFMINAQPYKDRIKFTNNLDNWAIQLGTTIEAMKAGTGDIGLQIKNDPSKLNDYLNNYKDKQPKIVDDFVMSDNDILYSIVHQYDRIPSLKEKIEKKYDDI